MVVLVVSNFNGPLCHLLSPYIFFALLSGYNFIGLIELLFSGNYPALSLTPQDF